MKSLCLPYRNPEDLFIMRKPLIYTIGHSTHPIGYFTEMLEAFSVNCLIDVRSIAASTYNPQYNKKPLTASLKEHGITYLHFAEEFGARHQQPELLDENGKVDFNKVRQSVAFQKGVERLRQGIEKGFIIALMCSEADPLDCHRFSMVSTALAKDGFEVNHILKDKTFKTQAALEAQLLKKYAKKIPKPDIFAPVVSLAEQLSVAYKLRNKEIGYVAAVREPGEQYD